MRRATLTLLLSLAVAGCDGGGDGSTDPTGLPDLPETETTWVEVAVLSAPPVERDAVYLFLEVDGEVVDWASVEDDLPKTLSADTTRTPVDAIVNAPASPTWAPGDPLGDGAYAVATNVIEDSCRVDFSATFEAPDGTPHEVAGHYYGGFEGH